ncbi:MAG: hypothetical protein HGA53_11115, partial [Anaerolineaceae bacterium]|nr:hypothetical protein [Anaerolineaceae bacterium]
NQAFALEELKRNDEALQAYQRSSDLLKEAGEKELRSTVLGRISGLQIKMGRQVEAITSMDAALNQKGHLSIKEKFLKDLIEKANKLIKGQ